MTENQCPRCSITLPSNAKFCNECGAEVTGGRPTPEKADRSRGSGGGKKGYRDVVIISAVIVIVVGGYILFKEPEALPEKPFPSGEAHLGMEGMVGSLPDLPTDYNSLVNVGNEFMDQANFAVAAECYKRALAIKHNSPDVRTDFGACLNGMGLPHRAIEEFMTVIKDHPEHGIANYNLGIVYHGTNEPDSARFYWEKYLAVDPNGPAAESARNFLEELAGGFR